MACNAKGIAKSNKLCQVRPEGKSRLAFFGVAEGFLATCLGGQAEPIGDDLKGSSLTVPAGASYIKGLTEALEGFKSEERG